MGYRLRSKRHLYQRQARNVGILPKGTFFLFFYSSIVTLFLFSSSLVVLCRFTQRKTFVTLSNQIDTIELTIGKQCSVDLLIIWKAVDNITLNRFDAWKEASNRTLCWFLNTVCSIIFTTTVCVNPLRIGIAQLHTRVKAKAKFLKAMPCFYRVELAFSVALSLFAVHIRWLINRNPTQDTVELQSLPQVYKRMLVMHRKWKS